MLLHRGSGDLTPIFLFQIFGNCDNAFASLTSFSLPTLLLSVVICQSHSFLFYVMLSIKFCYCAFTMTHSQCNVVNQTLLLLIHNVMLSITSIIANHWALILLRLKTGPEHNVTQCNASTVRYCKMVL